MQIIYWTVGIILFISNLIVPIITNKQNHEHDLKLKQLEAFSNNRFSLINSYYDNLMLYLQNTDSKSYLYQYKSSMAKLMSYVPSNIATDLELVDNDINQHLSDKSFEIFNCVNFGMLSRKLAQYSRCDNIK